MPGKTAKVTITERQHDLLQTIRNAPASSLLARQATIVLSAFRKRSNEEIATKVGLSRRQVSIWRRRWADAWDRLIRIECTQSHAALRRAVEQVLCDEPRAGSPGKFTPEQIVEILAVACEPPKKSGRPITHWTCRPRALADEVVRRGIIALDLGHPGGSLPPRGRSAAPQEAVSAQHPREGSGGLSGAGRGGLRYLPRGAWPWRGIKGRTRSAPMRMTGLQATERSAPTMPMNYGRPELIES